MPRTAFYFIPSAMTGFIVRVFSFRNRVSPKSLAPNSGVHTLTVSEKHKMLDQIVAAMGSPSPEVVELVRHIVSLEPEPAPDPGMQELGKQIARLKELVEKKFGQGANARFSPRSSPATKASSGLDG